MIIKIYGKLVVIFVILMLVCVVFSVVSPAKDSSVIGDPDDVESTSIDMGNETTPPKKRQSVLTAVLIIDP